jgi:hypothetical protein
VEEDVEKRIRSNQIILAIIGVTTTTVSKTVSKTVSTTVSTVVSTKTIATMQLQQRMKMRSHQRRRGIKDIHAVEEDVEANQIKSDHIGHRCHNNNSVNNSVNNSSNSYINNQNINNTAATLNNYNATTVAQHQ